MRQTTLLSALVLLLAAGPAGAQSASPSGGPGLTGFHPPVSISSLAQPMSWIDPSRFHVSTSVSVGSGLGSQGTNALQVTSLAYQFHAPVSLSVSLGNAWGPDAAVSGKNSFFLEGMRLAWQPSANTAFTFQFRDLRSPLQLNDYGYGYGYGYPRSRWMP